jgi:hypothetical protein
MEVEKCAVCSRPIKDGAPVVFDHGDCIHLACWRVLSSHETILESLLIRESRELLDRPSTEWKAQNDYDANGWPICPACTRPFRPGEGARRSGAYMLHTDCPELSH